MGIIMYNGQKYSGSFDKAVHISYDNSTSGLQAENVQAAVDEVNSKIKNLIDEKISMRSGQVTGIEIEANSSTLISVTFTRPFATVPVVSTHCASSGYELIVSFKNITVDGFEAWVRNVGSSKVTSRSIRYNAIGKE